VPPAVAAEQVSTVLGPFLVEVRAALPH